jgi:hypothetical protein
MHWTTNFLTPYIQPIDIMSAPLRIYVNRLKHCWWRPIKLTNATKWLDTNSRVMSRLLLDPIFDKGSRNHNEFELLFSPPQSLAHLEGLITPTWPLMVEIMNDDNTNALNTVILLISNGIAPFTNVEHAEKQHQDMHHELIMDASMMMESAAITISMDTKMEILAENAKLHCLFVSIYFPIVQKSNDIFFTFLHFPPFSSNELLCFFILPHL